MAKKPKRSVAQLLEEEIENFKRVPKMNLEIAKIMFLNEVFTKQAIIPSVVNEYIIEGNGKVKQEIKLSVKN